jgi:hypothetical protein
MEHRPKPAYETDRFLGTHIVGILMYENLECGHEIYVPWQCDPLTARYRTCKQCLSSTIPKEPVQTEQAYVPAKAA